MKAQKNGIVVDTRFETLEGDDIFEIDKNSLQIALDNILDNGKPDLQPHGILAFSSLLGLFGK